MRRRAKAIVLVNERVTDDQGGVTEARVFIVPRSGDFPEGVKYSLAYISSQGDRSPAVLYDNHRGKGHHRHVLGQETAYQFRGVDQLIADLKDDVDEVKMRRRQ